MEMPYDHSDHLGEQWNHVNTCHPKLPQIWAKVEKWSFDI